MNELLLEVNDARLWVCRSGAGLPVMLNSGGPGCCDYLQPVAEMIDDLAEVHRWEQRGCGRSEAKPPYDLDTCVQDLDVIRRTLGHDRWIIGGHSWGANLALAYAVAHPKHVGGLIYLSGTGIDRRWHPAYERNKARRGERLPEFAYPPNMEVNRVGNASFKQHCQLPDLPQRVAGLSAPALFVHGDRDLRPPISARAVAQSMPHARFELIQGAEHCLWLTHGLALRRVLREFIQRLRGAR